MTAPLRVTFVLTHPVQYFAPWFRAMAAGPDIDPTVIYAVPNFDGNLRKKDLSNPSPYNTYRWAGLPPGPIASPGADSIRAALFPAPSPYLYFVSKNDGTHQFSATLVEHNKAVEKYQKRPFRRVPHSQTLRRPDGNHSLSERGVA